MRLVEPWSGRGSGTAEGGSLAPLDVWVSVALTLCLLGVGWPGAGEYGGDEMADTTNRPAGCAIHETCEPHEYHVEQPGQPHDWVTGAHGIVSCAGCGDLAGPLGTMATRRDCLTDHRECCPDCGRPILSPAQAGDVSDTGMFCVLVDGFTSCADGQIEPCDRCEATSAETVYLEGRCPVHPGRSWFCDVCGADAAEFAGGGGGIEQHRAASPRCRV